MITHQISIVHELCDQVVVMEDGRIVDSGDTYRVFAHPRADLTRRFVAAVTQGAPSGATLEALRAGGGTLVSVDVNEFSSEDAVAVFERHGLRSAVVFGGVTDVRGQRLGTLTYRLDAGADAVAPAVAELRARTRVEVFDAEPARIDATGGSAPTGGRE